jgi:hypothetical protein
MCQDSDKENSAPRNRIGWFKLILILAPIFILTKLLLMLYLGEYQLNHHRNQPLISVYGFKILENVRKFERGKTFTTCFVWV